MKVLFFAFKQSLCGYLINIIIIIIIIIIIKNNNNDNNKNNRNNNNNKNNNSLQVYSFDTVHIKQHYINLKMD